MDDNYKVRDLRKTNMKSSFSLLKKRLDTCKQEVVELDHTYNQLKESLNDIPIAPQHRQRIELACLQSAKIIDVLKSKILSTERLLRQTEVR